MSAPAAAAPLAAPDGAATLLRIVRRIVATVEAETESLAAGRLADEGGFAERKALLLLEFTRAARAVDAAGAPPDLVAALRAMKMALGANQAALGVRLDAARRVAETLTRVVADIESDGTYAAASARRAPR